MTSFIYQPRLDEQEDLNVVSSINKDPKPQLMASAPRSIRKSRVLHQSSSKMKRKQKQTDKDKGLTYSSKALDFWSYNDEEDDNGGRKDRSLKINCSGPVEILADIQDLNYEYVPKSKKQDMQQQSPSKRQQQQKQEQQVFVKEIVEAEKREGEEESFIQIQGYDMEEARQKKINQICFMLLILILVWATSPKLRQLVFRGFLVLRQTS